MQEERKYEGNCSWLSLLFIKNSIVEWYTGLPFQYVALYIPNMINLFLNKHGCSYSSFCWSSVRTPWVQGLTVRSIHCPSWLECRIEIENTFSSLSSLTFINVLQKNLLIVHYSVMFHIYSDWWVRDSGNIFKCRGVAIKGTEWSSGRPGELRLFPSHRRSYRTCCSGSQSGSGWYLESGREESIGKLVHFQLVFVCESVCSCKLTSRHAVEADVDLCGPHWHAAGQAAQHGLHREALGLLTLDKHLLLQLYRFILHQAACEE